MSEAGQAVFDELYQEIIMDHYRHPRGAASLDRVPDSRLMENPTCGDAVKLEVQLDGEGRVREVLHDGHGCAISTASASLMTEATRGLEKGEVRDMAERVIAALRGDEGPEKVSELDDLGDLAALGGVRGLPLRVKCATLAWRALLAAL